MDQKPSFSKDSMANIVPMLNKKYFLPQIRPKNSVSPFYANSWQIELNSKIFGKPECLR